MKRIKTIAFRRDKNPGGLSFYTPSSFLSSGSDFHLLLLLACLFFTNRTGFTQETTPPVLVFNPISIQLDPAGQHTLTPIEIARIAAGSTAPCGTTNLTVTPSAFTFCDVGLRTVTLSLADCNVSVTNRSGLLEVLAPTVPPHSVYVDASYPVACASVAFPNNGSLGTHFVNFDAFTTIQAAVNHVADDGTVSVAPGTYAENVVITKPLSLLGPNAGTPRGASVRRPEAKIIPACDDPENAPILSVESDDVLIDGLLLDGANDSLAGGYDANGVRVHAAAGVQNGTYPDLADVEHITIQNNIITNMSYDGVCLDRYQYFGTSSAWNYIWNNQFANMWEGILTYALDAVIANNIISNVTHGLGVHCVNTPSPPGFSPLIASNALTIAQWWPVEIQATRAPGIWINYRRDKAAPIDVVANVVNTPTPPPPLKAIIGLFALTVDGSGKINFIDNVVNGDGNCTVGFLAASCSSNHAVQLLGGSLNEINGTGALAGTLDVKWGAGDSLVTISNVAITLRPGGSGVLALQETATAANRSSVEVISNTAISGGACGVEVRGENASASVVGNGRPISGNGVGIHLSGGRALLEGNNLTNNRIAAILVENNGLVDAGDCSGANVTGLGTGSGVDGASAGLNDFSGYGFDKLAPWAITNSGSVPVRADHNIFGAGAISGPVTFSASGVSAISAPPALAVECIGQVPTAARTPEEFLAAGGVISASSVVSISSRDTVVTNRAGHYTISRCYSVADTCGQPLSCNQSITARDDHGPILHCSSNILQAVDKGCDYATVTFTNLAADACGELLGPWDPVSTGRFPIGTNTVIVIATDLANNSTACSFDIAVVGPPIITQQPLSRTNNAGTTASFKVAARSAAPLSFQWKKNDVALVDRGTISGTASSEVIVAPVSDADAADYSVDVSNFAGVASSVKAHLSVVTPRGNLRLLEFSGSSVTLQLTGPAGLRFAILTSTNLDNWVGLCTNTAPFTFVHTNAPGPGWRFYRALHAF